MAQFHNPNLAGAGGQGGYEIGQSLRFNSADSAYLSRTPGSAGNRKTWTWSGWVKRSKISDFQYVFGAGPGANDSTFAFYGDDTFACFLDDGTSATGLRTTAVYRDASAWYHIVVALDTTQATSTNRLKIYINGTQITTFGTTTYPNQNTDWNINNTYSHTLGRARASSYLSAYLAEINFIDGTALTPSSFGETDTITGAWIPKKYSGSFGTNGFYLKFESSGIGTDSSGNGNTWTANNFSTSGTGTDVMSDTPTNNWCTGNPLAVTSGDGVWTNSGGGNGNLSAYLDNTRGGLVTIPCPNTGKWYCEITPTTSTASGGRIGLSPTSNTRWVSNNGDFSDGTYNGYAYDTSGNKVSGGTSSSYGASYGANDVIGIAFDSGGGTLTFYKNGTSQGTAFTSISTNENWVFAFRGASASSFVVTLNFGQRAFAYTPPTGYKALNTANLPEPTIKDGGKYFNTVLWSGNDTYPRAITGVGFSPDLIWIKPRSTADDHTLMDVLRGTGNLKWLSTNSTSAEGIAYNNANVTSLDSDGFTIGTTGGTNQLNASTRTPVAWCWDAGGTGSTNTAGSITSTVSANASAGFSIVTYTGTGSAVTVGHGLGVAPAMVIVKDRSTNPGYSWYVYHQKLTSSSYFLRLNTTGAQTFSTDPFNGTAPTSTVFSVGGENVVNTHNYVAYCFSEVAGYSKFGSYTGNGSSDGPFVFCGFRPRLVMIKRTDSTSDWVIYDTARDTYNASVKNLNPDLSSSEGIGYDIDILSNGFKQRTVGGYNGSGGTYVFAAFAEMSFGGQNVPPATAR